MDQEQRLLVITDYEYGSVPKFEMDEESTYMAIMTRFRSNYGRTEWNTNTRKLDACTVTDVE